MAAVLAAVAWWPTTRLIGVNSVITEQHLPLWVKGLNFIDRDANMDQLTREVFANAGTDERRLMAAFEWTRAHIKPPPEGLTVVDDHIWHIVIRGYGTSDQQADVLTTLLSYEGQPAFWMMVGKRPTEVPIAFVLVDGDWRALDVQRGLIFRTAAGGLATTSEIERDHTIIRAAAAGLADADFYTSHFAAFHAPQPPDETRAAMQQPLPRLWFEMRKLVGMEGRVWQMREPPAVSEEQRR